MLNKFTFILVAVASLGLGCAKLDPSGQIAHKNIKESFDIAKVEVSNLVEIKPGELATVDRDLQVDQYKVSIKKSALGKEFLLTGALIPQSGAATGQGLQSRVVSFLKRDDSLFMLESTEGHVITNDLPATLILAEFSITKETTDILSFDFNEGMGAVFTQDNWGAGGTGDIAGALEVRKSFINKAEFDGNVLEIRHQVQAKKTGFSGVSLPSVEVRYTLRPYLSNPGFKAKRISKFKNVGFFAVPGYIEKTTGNKVVNTTRWDKRKEITFYVSANTPADLQETVKEGIVYWDRALKDFTIKAEIAPKGMTAPSHSHNIIQWVPWDNAGFAYADANMDPRSGEFLNAQVFLTSAFYVGGIRRARRVHRGLKKVLASNTDGIFHWNKDSHLCFKEVTENYADALGNMIMMGASDAAFKKVSRDYLRLVTAHEVGHVMGLRHNFAGTLATKLTHTEREKMFNELVMEDKEADVDRVPTSTVMDYLDFRDAVIAGRAMKNGKILDYDKAALEWGYADRELVTGKDPLFCTDDHVGTFADCNRFDSGDEPVKDAISELQKRVETLPENLLNKFVNAVQPADPNDAVTVKEVSLSPNGEAGLMAAELMRALKYFNANTRSLAIERSFSFVGSLNKQERLKAHLDAFETQMKDLGGVKDVILAPFAEYGLKSTMKLSATSTRVLDRVKDLLSKQVDRGMIASDGKSDLFSQTEQSLILDRVEGFMEMFNEAYLNAMLSALAGSKYDLEYEALEDFPVDGTSVVIENTIGKIAEKVMMDKSDKREVRGMVRMGALSPTVVFDRFAYKKDTRLTAAKMLSARLGPVKDWSSAARTTIKKRLVLSIQNSLGLEMKDINEKVLSRSLNHWYEDQKAILGLLF